jgi:hypothetical protein
MMLRAVALEEVRTAEEAEAVETLEAEVVLLEATDLPVAPALASNVTRKVIWLESAQILRVSLLEEAKGAASQVAVAPAPASSAIRKATWREIARTLGMTTVKAEAVAEAKAEAREA